MSFLSISSFIGFCLISFVGSLYRLFTTDFNILLACVSELFFIISGFSILEKLVLAVLVVLLVCPSLLSDSFRIVFKSSIKLLSNFSKLFSSLASNCLYASNCPIFSLFIGIFSRLRLANVFILVSGYLAHCFASSVICLALIGIFRLSSSLTIFIFFSFTGKLAASRALFTTASA